MKQDGCFRSHVVSLQDLLHDTSSPQEDQYPPNIAVKVNHSYCSVPVSQLGWEAPRQEDSCKCYF